MLNKAYVPFPPISLNLKPFPSRVEHYETASLGAVSSGPTLFAYLLLHDKLLWHLELQSTSFFLHLQAFVLQPVLQAHFVNPWPLPIDCALAALRTEISHSLLMSDSVKPRKVVVINWLRENIALRTP